MRFNAPPWAAERPPELVVATRSRHKLSEFSRILSETPWRLLSLDDAGFSDDVDEPFDTYEDNARRKAEVVAARLGRAVVADDSGIEIIALDGWPGTRSARWMGPDTSDADRLAGLVAEVERRTPHDRRARYVAALALAVPGRETAVIRGVVEGEIVEPSGSGGFGYDPAFFSTELGKRFGEADAGEKDRVSHRGRALRALAAGHLGVDSWSE